MVSPRGGARSGILDSLKRAGEMTASELAEKIGITAVAARQHLAVLEAEGLVASEPRRSGVGRPSDVYWLTEKGMETFPRLYDEFLLTVLTAVTELDGEKGLDRILEWRNADAVRAHGRRLQDLEPRARAKALYEMLEASGHLPEMEERRDEIVVTEHNCPISRVSRRFPRICVSELELLHRLTRLPVTRDACLAEGARVCRYHIPVGTTAPLEKKASLEARPFADDGKTSQGGPNGGDAT